LIVDLRDIDKIIFEKKIPYNGVNNYNMDNVLNSVLG
jgi:hypothetical protein